MAHIALVEDNPHNQAIFRAVLERRGHHVVLLPDGAAALAYLAEHVPDLLLLDLSIPKVDGWTVARRIRASDDARLRDVPIVALTAHAMKGDRNRAIEAGCDRYVPKPVSPRVLDRVVTEVLEGDVRAA
ncbi:MAG: response regulator [Deltaproteobacteria bacterium]|nr:MAG: response regulator [Deltaproteobacteria bacterium]